MQNAWVIQPTRPGPLATTQVRRPQPGAKPGDMKIWDSVGRKELRRLQVNLLAQEPIAWPSRPAASIW